MLNKRIFKTMIFAMGALVPIAYGVNYLKKNKEKKCNATKLLIAQANSLYDQTKYAYGDFCDMWPSKEFVEVCLLKGKFKSNEDRGYYYSYAQNLQTLIGNQYLKLQSEIYSYIDYVKVIFSNQGCSEKDNIDISKKLNSFRTQLKKIDVSATELEQVWTPLYANDANAIEGMLAYMRAKNAKKLSEENEKRQAVKQEQEKEFELNKLKLENEKIKLANETEKYVADKKLQAVSNLGLNAACMFKNMFKNIKKDDE